MSWVPLLVLFILVQVTLCWEFDFKEILEMLDSIAHAKTNGNIKECHILHIEDLDEKSNYYLEGFYEDRTSFRYSIRNGSGPFPVYHSGVLYYRLFGYHAIGRPSQPFHSRFIRSTTHPICIILLIHVMSIPIDIEEVTSTTVVVSSDNRYPTDNRIISFRIISDNSFRIIRIK